MVFKGERKIARVLKIALPSEDGAVSEEIREKIPGSSGFRKDLRIFLNVPRHLTIVRFAKFPSVDGMEIRKMARMETIKNLPQTGQEVVYGHRVVEKMADGYSAVLLAVVQKNTVDHLVRLVQNAGFSVEGVALGSESLLLWSRVAVPEIKAKTAMLVNVAGDYLDMVVLDEEKPVFIRGALLDTRSAEKVASEVKISVDSYRRQSSRDIECLYLCGPDQGLGPLAKFLRERLEVDTQVIDHLRRLPVQGFSGEPLEGSFAAVVGLALYPGEAVVDLMPAELSSQKRFRMLKKSLFRTATLALAVAVFMAAAALNRLVDKKQTVSYLDAEAARHEKKAAKVKGMMEDIENLGPRAGGPLAVDVLREIHALTPQGVQLGFFDLTDDGVLTLRGSAPQLGDVFKYIGALEKSRFFENVKLKYVIKRKTENRPLSDFELAGVISKENA